MNKQELDARTGLNSSDEEFAAIEAVYMTAPDMDKDAAARLYRKLYGKAKSAADFLAALGIIIWNLRTLAAIGREWEQDAAAYAADGVEME